MAIITLTTDFGLKDHFVGALKGKILSTNPEVSIVDISHDIDPFNIVEASYIISAAYSNFPKGTVHLIGVDIEFTDENKHVAIQWEDQYFVAADNGILSRLCQKIVPQKIVAINIHDHIHNGTSDLDVLAQVACHLSKGGLLSVIGKEIQNLKEVTEMQVLMHEATNQLKGSVMYIDHFGNVVTNISKSQFLEAAKGRKFEILLLSKEKKPLTTIQDTYSDIVNSDKYPAKFYEGSKLALFNDAGYLEIALYRSNPSKTGTANTLLGLNFRDPITIQFY